MTVVENVGRLFGMRERVNHKTVHTLPKTPRHTRDRQLETNSPDRSGVA